MTLLGWYENNCMLKEGELRPGNLYSYTKRPGNLCSHTQGDDHSPSLALYLGKEFCEVTYTWVHRFDVKGVSLIFGPKEIGRYFIDIDSNG